MSRQDLIKAAMARIEDAAFDPQAWDEALRAVAAATGGRFGQLIAIGGREGPAFNRLPDMDPDLRRQWAEVNGHHPGVNSRIRIGGAAPVMRVLDETSFTTEADSRRNPAYGDLIDRADIPFICLTTLVREPGVQIGMAVMRGRAQGNVEAEDRRIFALLAYRARQAIRTTLVLGE
ncbi:hypothetical protein D8I30_13820 [Brevundimonas naejangsanensis]|uniref:GAF domain-containing protein n=1 Tax=Brevundimonas naejangsanensis TaxID=588932 RepID=A0A494RI53_9CAUL|nr:hypothetical protein [Brevundimonas naejangsanensis]AYG96128.1 hypothetical protein D8I30_13820 [Brevundimonas naejangsanensis]